MDKYLKTIDFSSSSHGTTLETIRFARTNEAQIPGGGTVRIRVRHDRSYHFQSSASLDIWTADGWSEVTKVLPLQVDNTSFGTDKKMGVTEARLFKAAANILGWI